jgi:NitT/TauT family transport system permease protein
MSFIRNPFVESVLALIALFAVWEAIVRLLGVPSFILPPPSLIFGAVSATAPVLLYHSFVTLSGTFLSLLAGASLGMTIGLLVGYSQTLSRLLYPLLGGLHALPMSAFIPIFVVWFGVGSIPKIVAGMLIAFFPVVVNVVTGLRTIENDLWEMLRVIGANKRQVFHKIGIPRTLPYFFASLKVAAAGAFIGNVVGEMIAAGAGLGYVLIVATTSLNMPLAFGALTVLLLFGVLLFTTFDTVEKYLAPWAYRRGND